MSKSTWDRIRSEASGRPDDGPQAALSGKERPFRLALITAGQSPRLKISADLAAALPEGIEIFEFGALDGSTDLEIAALNPKQGQPALQTRLRDDRTVLVSRIAVHAKIQAILSRFKPNDFDLAAIFCTGAFDAFVSFVSSCRLIQSQPALENAVSMLVRSGHRICVIVPRARQVDEDKVLGLDTYQRQVTWLDPADEADWARVVAISSNCEVLVLNSLDYDEEAAMRLGRETSLPAILPRRVLASAIRLVLDVDQMPHTRAPSSAAIAPLLERLTPRERQVMWLMVEGLQSKQIGPQLDISLHTVSIHRANVLAKLDVPNTNTLIRLMLGRLGR